MGGLQFGTQLGYRLPDDFEIADDGILNKVVPP